MGTTPLKPRFGRNALLVPLLFWAVLPAFFIAGCGSKSDPPLPEIDFNKAKAISDAVADDLVRKDVNDLSDKLDVGFHAIVKGPDDLRKVVEKMYSLYGRPLKCDYKVAQSGVRTDATWKRSTRTFFYAVKTTRYPMGKYFLKIEVVSAFNGGFLDVSGFGFFTFKEGVEVPSYLR
ncbi:MAG TPA: hypothetical protein VJ873_03315 [bacterium]|nr:hypothetical protein [bacterium]